MLSLRKMILNGCLCLSAIAFWAGGLSVQAAVDAPSSIVSIEEQQVEEIEGITEEEEPEEPEEPEEEDKEETLRKDMVAYAKKFLGNRYVYGGTSLTKGTDCSGFTMRIYQKFGYKIPRTSRSQSSASKKISSAEKKPGDLIFYGSGKRVSHVAMYIGNNKVIHASNAKSGIKISKWNYRRYIKIGRFIR